MWFYVNNGGPKKVTKPSMTREEIKNRFSKIRDWTERKTNPTNSSSYEIYLLKLTFRAPCNKCCLTVTHDSLSLVDDLVFNAYGHKTH